MLRPPNRSKTAAGLSELKEREILMKILTKFGLSIVSLAALFSAGVQASPNSSGDGGMNPRARLKWEIEQIDQSLKSPNVHRWFDPGSDRPVTAILQEERAAKVKQLKIMELNNKIEVIASILKDDASKIHQMRDTEGRPAVEILNEEIENAQKEIESLKGRD